MEEIQDSNHSSREIKSTCRTEATKILILAKGNLFVSNFYFYYLLIKPKRLKYEKRYTLYYHPPPVPRPDRSEIPLGRAGPTQSP